MITLHSCKEKIFKGIGLAVLDNEIINPIVTESMNSIFSLEFEMLASSKKANMIEKGMIIEAPTPLGDELFRVRAIEKSVEDYDIVFFYCSQIFFCDMEDNFIEDTNIVGKTGYTALDQLQSNTVYPHDFNFHSDISTVNNSRVVRKNFVTAIIGNDNNSFINRWGGELQVNRFDVKMLSRRGKDRGVSILYRKNLLGLNSKIDYTTVYTRAMPEGADGLFLEEKYVDSPNIDHEHPIIRLVEFKDIKVKSNDAEEGYSTIEEARIALREAAEKLFTQKYVDQPEATYQIEFQELSQTEEYKNYTVLERVFLGDTVQVKHEDIGISVTARCLEYKYNPKTKEYISITLGNVVNSFTSETNKKQEDILDKVEGNKTEFQKKLEEAINHLTDLINSGLYGHVILTGNEILIMDTTDINTAREVWRYNINGFGYSSTGYNGPFIGLAKDGKLVIDEATAHKITAIMIKGGVLQALNNKSWIDLDDGTFNFAEKLICDKNGNISLEGKITNGYNGYATTIDRGGHIFKTEGENVGAIRSSSFPSNRNLNGLSIVAMEQGDYVDIGYTDSTEIDENSTFIPVIRYAKTKHELLGNFIGIQLKAETRVDYGKKLLFQNNTAYDSEIHASATGHLNLYGDNGFNLGYKAGDSYVSAIQMDESSDAIFFRSKMRDYKDGKSFEVLSRYNHGSVERFAPRISNMNAYLDSGWYSFGSDCAGTPTSWGVMLTFRAFTNDMCQIVHGTNNVLYIRWYVNGAYTPWKSW